MALRPVVCALPRLLSTQRANLTRTAINTSRTTGVVLQKVKYSKADNKTSEPCLENEVVSLPCIKKLLEDSKVQLIDVRSREEIEETGKIPGSINIPRKFFQLVIVFVSDLVVSSCVTILGPRLRCHVLVVQRDISCQGYRCNSVIFRHSTVDEVKDAFRLSPDEFEEKYKVAKPKPQDDNITFHCRTGKRAQNAIKIIQELGYDR